MHLACRTLDKASLDVELCKQAYSAAAYRSTEAKHASLVSEHWSSTDEHKLARFERLVDSETQLWDMSLL